MRWLLVKSVNIVLYNIDSILVLLYIHSEYISRNLIWVLIVGRLAVWWISSGLRICGVRAWPKASSRLGVSPSRPIHVSISGLWFE